MANGGEIDIKVNFVGLNELDRIMNEIGQGATRVGQQVGQVGRSFDELLGEGVEGLEEYQEGIEGLGEGLGDLNERYEENENRQRRNQDNNKKSIDLYNTLGNSLGQTGQAFTTLSDRSSQAMGGVISSAGSAVGALGNLATASKTAGASFTSMLGPIGLVALGVFEVIKAFREYSDRIDFIDAKVQAYKASLSEMTTVLEQLATKQIPISRKEIADLQELNNQGKIRIEMAQELRETQAKAVGQLARLKVEEEKLNKTILEYSKAGTTQLEKRYKLAPAQRSLNYNLASQAELQQQINKLDEKSLDIAKEGYPFRLEFEKKLAEIEKRSPKLLEERAKQEAQYFLQLEALKNKAVNTGVKARLKALDIEHKMRVNQIDAMFKDDENARNRARAKELEVNKLLRERILKEDREQRAERAKAKQRESDAQRAQEIAEQKRAEEQRRALDAQILQNELRMDLEGFEQRRELLSAQYDEQLRLAGDNYQKQLLAKQQYILASAQLDKQEDEQEEQAYRKRWDTRLKRYNEEINLEIKRRNNLAKQNQAIIEGALQSAEAMATSSMASAVASAMAGESMDKVLKEQMKMISTQAMVQSALNGAKALGALATGDLGASALYAKASLAFAGVATLAGLAGAGGGGTSPAPASSSPTGAPLVSTPERESMRESSETMVFNISMGTVYSTEESALRALTDTITREQNRVRRGAPRNA